MDEELKMLLDSAREGAPLEPEVAERLLGEYPYLSVAASRALLSKNLTDNQRRRFQAAVALNAPDAKTLITLIDPDGFKFANFYPDENEDATPSTDNAIDTFLDTYGHGVDPKEEALLERLIFNPVPADYSELLKSENNEPDEAPAEHSEQDALLDAFLDSQGALHQEAKSVQKETDEDMQPKPEYHAKPDPEAPLSESLAKIFVKRQRYDKAYEIISQLSLNYPEKSVYFADQLRFLRKLIINQKYDKTKK